MVMNNHYLRKIFLPVCFIIFAVAFIFSGYGRASNAETKETLAPDFSLQDLSGKTVSLKDYRGKFVLLDFWGTFCPPCRMTIPELIDLQTKYKDKGLVVLGVSLDESKNTDDKALKQFAEENKINYTIMRADEKILSDYFGSNPHHIPLLKFIDKNGMIVDSHDGYEAGALEKKLKNYIK
jgi:cytochrome c biogenesis protein CcmG, thiol:disulfide interchange protein DsbE